MINDTEATTYKNKKIYEVSKLLEVSKTTQTHKKITQEKHTPVSKTAHTTIPRCVRIMWRHTQHCVRAGQVHCATDGKRARESRHAIYQPHINPIGTWKEKQCKSVLGPVYLELLSKNLATRTRRANTPDYRALNPPI